MVSRRTVTVALALALMGAVFAQQQDTKDPDASQHSTGDGMHDNCRAIAAGDARLEPVSRLCEFALGYQRSLPNFICEEETVSRATWLGGPAPSTIRAQVTFQDGVEKHSNVLVNGAPDRGIRSGTEAAFRTEGEFGRSLVDLFTPPLQPEFRFVRRTKLRGLEALEFSFHIPQEQNLTWRVGDGNSWALPEFRGGIWLEAASARLLRISVEPMRLPKNFQMESSEEYTDYEEVNLGEAGIHLLATRAVSRGCLRTPPSARGLPQSHCITNTLQFHGCRKFGAKARIVEQPQ